MHLPTDFILPDYQSGSICNLMVSIGAALGGAVKAGEARLLPAKNLGKRQVLLVIDGLGYEHLLRVSANGFLAQHCKGSVTSVVPSATASAIPTFLTGDPPVVHGFTGWFTWFRELSMTLATLPFASRAGFNVLENTAVTPIGLSQSEPFANRIEVPAWHVAPLRIAHSRFNRDFAGRATISAYREWPQMEKLILQIVKKFKPHGFIYAYWPDYDHIAHQFGVNSAEADDHLIILENQVAELAHRLRNQDIDLVVCADHGFTDCPQQTRFELSRDFDALAQMTRLSLTGEPRLAYAYVKQGAIEDFLQASAELLDGVATVVKSEELIDEGVFGQGKQHPSLKERIGDLCLLMHQNTVVFDPLPGELPPHLMGYHGGLSAEEMYVPLIHCRC